VPYGHLAWPIRRSDRHSYTEVIKAELIAIGYDDMETADKAAEELYRVAHDLVIEPEAVAVIVRDEKGRYHSGPTTIRSPKV
jgi:hypothetical protein